METQEQQPFALPDKADIVRLLTALKGQIRDEYRCTDDPDDDQPGMLVTIGASKDGTWSYQTGDNSYTGGAYGHPFWGLAYLLRDSDLDELAESVLDEISEQMVDA